MPIVVSLVPWFTLLAVIALVCAIVSKRTVSIVMAVLAIALQAFWQYPFFYQPSKLPRAAVAAASGETVNTDDGYARLMTCNVYKGAPMRVRSWIWCAANTSRCLRCRRRPTLSWTI